MTTDDLLPKSQVIALIAEKMEVSTRHVADRILKRSDFPKPRRRIGHACVYARQDVEKWLGIK